MKSCPNPECPYARRHGAPAEYREDAATCSDCGAPLAQAEQAPPRPANAPRSVSHPAPWTRLAVTVGAALASVLATVLVPLPGLQSLSASGAESLFDRAQGASLFALGLSPLVSGFIVVEFASLIVPPWRSLRTGGPVERAKLTKASWVVALGLAILQARTLASFFANQGVVAVPSTATASLLAGVAVLALVAHLVDRFGLGNGIAVVLAAGSLAQIPAALARESSRYGSAEGATSPVLFGLVGCSAVVAATWFLLSGRWSRAQGPSPIAVPTCGIVPLNWAASLLALPASLSAFFPFLFDVSHQLQESRVAHDIILLAFVLASGLLLSFLFNRPSAIARAHRRSGANAAALRAALVRASSTSLLFVVGLGAVPTILSSFNADLLVPTSALALLTAVVLDVAAEWRATLELGPLAPAWPIHQLFAVAPAMELLAASGITAHARFRRYRSLLHFFGPYSPVMLLVPVGQEHRAWEILDKALLDAPPPGADLVAG